MYFKGMGVERVIPHFTDVKTVTISLDNIICMILSQDYSTAMEYFQKAADKGSHEANLYIGLGYLCMSE